jgi:hypothetical protein
MTIKLRLPGAAQTLTSDSLYFYRRYQHLMPTVVHSPWSLIFGLVRPMTARLALFLGLALSVTAKAAPTSADTIKWNFDSKTRVWTSPEIGIALRKSIAGFQQKSAEPYAKDGSAFGYWGEHGALTLIVERRGAGGYPGTGEYRYSFVNKAGAADLETFLGALGMKKI